MSQLNLGVDLGGIVWNWFDLGGFGWIWVDLGGFGWIWLIWVDSVGLGRIRLDLGMTMQVRVNEMSVGKDVYILGCECL